MSNKCLVCFGDKLKPIYKPKYNISVTSDNMVLDTSIELIECKECGHLQKNPDSATLDKIYAEYSTNKLAPNEEQIKFDSAAKQSRSAVLLQNILEELPKQGDILDIGSGGGGMLRSLFTINPDYKLYANDLNKNAILELEAIPSFCGFFDSLENLEQKFDLITMVHVLEHINDTEKFLNLVSSLLKPNGILLIQIPNISQNIFDIFVYDHISHFDKSRVEKLLLKFFKYVVFPQKQINKEITVFASNKRSFKINKLDNIQDEQKFEISRIDEVFDMMESVKENISVFGTSPICTFFGAILGDRLLNFYDEDLNKQGKINLGKITLSLDDYKGELILLPFARDIAQKIMKRLEGIRFLKI